MSTAPRTPGPAAPPPGASGAHPPLWRHHDYLLLWSGQVVSTLGANASGVVYPLLILALTGSPAQAAWASALRIIPYLLLSLPVGALIDRWNRRRVMITCHLGRAATVASLPLAMALGRLTVEQIYVVAVIEGALHVFFNIAETAALPRVVPAALLPQATAQNNAGYAMSAVVGPALGTWLYQAVSRALPFVVDAITHLLGAVAVWRLRTSFVPAAPAAPRDLRAEVAEGLRWLWGQRLVRDMALITCVLNFVQAATPLLLIVLAKQMHASEAQIGVMFSLGGVGAILGALVGGLVHRRFSFGQVIIGTIALQALLFPVYAASPGPLWLGLVYGLIMFFGPIYNVVQLSYRISLIPDGLQGRVNSSFRLIAFALNPVGAALCGLTLEHWGTTPTVWLFGTCYALVALAAWADPAVRLARHADTTATAN